MVLTRDEGPCHAVVPPLPVEQQVSTSQVQLAHDQLRLEVGVVELDSVKSVEQRDDFELVGGQYVRCTQLTQLLRRDGKTIITLLRGFL